MLSPFAWARYALLFVLLALVAAPVALAQSGKIAGRVTERGTGLPLPGVNVAIAGTTQGTISDMDGYYSILNVSPGIYDLRASFVGFTPQVVTGVDVNIGLTTTINFQLSEEVIEGGEVIIVADRPVVQVDVAASTANISEEQIESLPVASIEGAVGLQAGIQGLSVRGSGSDEVLLNVNGLSLRDERNNTPFTGLSLLSVQEIQVQTGGFTAKYGNLRSGLINIVTKEGQRDRYEASALVRYSPARPKNFGSNASDPNSYWMRPFLDPDVAFTGTKSGAWDRYTQRQYEEFDGWIAVSEARLADDDPSNDLTPAALQDAFRWQRSKVMEIQSPDYSMDFGFGGPVPGLSRFGGTRFYATHRRTQAMYFIPQSRDRYGTHSTYAKVTSNVSRNVKLSLEGLYGRQSGISDDRSGQPGIFASANSQASELSGSFVDTRIYATDYWAPTDVRSFLLGGKVTYTPTDRSFLEVRFSRFASDYDTGPGALRDTSVAQVIGGVNFDELPFGFLPDLSTNGVDGMRASVGMSNARDTSEVVVYNLRADFTSQVNRFLEVETGGEFAYVDSRVRYGQFDAVLPTSNTYSFWNEAPLRGALYGQGKFESQGMVANLGLRMDYFNANTEWYEYDPFTAAFSAAGAAVLDTLLSTSPTKNIVTFSPRLAVSFPITQSSKLYFNYGHFRQQPDPNNLYLLRSSIQTGQISRVASPNNPFPRTVSYELGYDQSFLDEFLVRVAGYYKDVSLQPFQVEYLSRDNQTEYTRSEPNSYEDIRGFEFTVERNQGRWIQGFINYTYRVSRLGYFGSRRNFENSTQQQQFDESDAERQRALTRPQPLPFARANINLLLPEDLGPSAGGLYPLGGWMVSFLGTWADAGKSSWADGFSVPAAALRNLDVTDSWNLDLRFAKDFSYRGNSAELFIDVYNVLNRRRLSPFTSGFVDGTDRTDYYASLHLPESEFYSNLVGDDKVGTYRDPDVAYQPMERLTIEANVPSGVNERAFYYAEDTERWVSWNGDAFVPADMDAVQQALDDKAYIDMPNQGFLTFLNPRDVYLGVRFNF